MKKAPASSFDPYRRWLGIPQSEQPAHHYRLLGLALFEEDPEVIEGAADRQMTHVRKFQTGPYSADSQRLLNELAAARLCLLDRERKKDYDFRLRLRLENKGELRPLAAPASVVVAPPPVMPPPPPLVQATQVGAASQPGSRARSATTAGAGHRGGLVMARALPSSDNMHLPAVQAVATSATAVMELPEGNLAKAGDVARQPLPDEPSAPVALPSHRGAPAAAPRRRTPARRSSSLGIAIGLGLAALAMFAGLTLLLMHKLGG